MPEPVKVRACDSEKNDKNDYHNPSSVALPDGFYRDLVCFDLWISVNHLAVILLLFSGTNQDPDSYF